MTSSSHYSDDDEDGWQVGSQGAEQEFSSEEESMDEEIDSVDYEEGQSMPYSYSPSPQPLLFCTNCTSRLGFDTLCDDCGHCRTRDSELLDASMCEPMHVFGSSTGASPVALAFDERMTLHEEGRATPHPERPDRIMAIITRLLASGIADQCLRIPCREAHVDELMKVHTTELVNFVEASATGRYGLPMVPPDTYINEHTHVCAKLAAGSAAEVASCVARGEAGHGAAIVRPPGHHAESGMAMGFCFFNNAAVAARAAQAAGAQRVLILDWDVHHGNGTQHIFENDPSVMFMSLHRYDGGAFYPGTGSAHEVGMGQGEGFTLNVPWNSRDMRNGDYLSAFQLLLLPVAYEFNPDLVIVSAGFDAAEGDPIGECRLTPECFAHMTAMLKALAPTVLLLEGGYNLRSTAMATEACLRVLLGEQPPNLPGPRYPSLSGWQSIQASMEIHARYWMSLVHARERNPPTGACTTTTTTLTDPLSSAAMYESEGKERQQHLGGSGGGGDGPMQATVSCSDISHYCSQGAGDGQGGHPARFKAAATDTSGDDDMGMGTNGDDPMTAGVADGSRDLNSRELSRRYRDNLMTLPRKQRIMLSIHRRAMRSLWSRRGRVAK